MTDKAVLEMRFQIPADVAAPMFGMTKRFFLEHAREDKCLQVPKPHFDSHRVVTFKTKDIADALGADVNEVAEVAAALAA